MQIDLAAHIEKLLFLHDQLNIPSFGGFSVRRVPAAPDYAGGTINPPSKALTFNENLTTDDGLLVQEVATANGISTEEARRVIQEFVDQIQAALNQREIVTLPGIGRLYKNYVQKIQFLPDATNFDTEAFGLPPLQFSPIARSRPVEEPAPAPVTNAGNRPTVATAPAPPTPPSPPPAPVYPAGTEPDWSPRKEGASRGLAFFGVLLLFTAIGLGVWWVQRTRANQAALQGDATETPAEKPGRDRAAAAEDVPAKPSTPARQRAEPVEPDPETAPADDTEEANAGGRLCILIVATLREKANADRLIALLEGEGYEVYTVEKNGYQVGIQFRYKAVDEIQDKMVALQTLTKEPNIWIKKR
jgi:cell division septation protein DedD